MVEMELGINRWKLGVNGAKLGVFRPKLGVKNFEQVHHLRDGIFRSFKMKIRCAEMCERPVGNKSREVGSKSMKVGNKPAQVGSKLKCLSKPAKQTTDQKTNGCFSQAKSEKTLANPFLGYITLNRITQEKKKDIKSLVGLFVRTVRDTLLPGKYSLARRIQ